MAKPTKKLHEAHPSTNPLDSKPIRNPLAGANWKPVTGNKFAGSVEHHKNPKSKVSFPTGRLGLVYRSLEDGANLIEDSTKLLRMIEREVELSEKNFFKNDDLSDDEQLEDPPEEIQV